MRNYFAVPFFMLTFAVLKLYKMEKEFIPYEQALALKELGFDEPCFGYRDGCGHLMINSTPHCVISAPTFSQAFRWFRENYKLRGHVISDYDMFSYQIYGLIDNEFNLINGGSVNKEYEEAELECLKKLIEIVKEK